MKTRRKKLLLIGPLPPPYAGPEIGTGHLLGSKTLNHAYDIYHINTSLRKSNAERGRLDVRMILAYLGYIGRLVRALILFRPERVLYCIMSATTKGWVRDGSTILLCRLAGIMPVMQFRGGHFRYFYDSLPAFQKRAIKWLLSKTGMVLAQADVLKKQFFGLLDDGQIGKLYNSVPVDFFHAFDDHERKGHNYPINVLFVGHLSFAKGYCDLLEVMSDIMQEQPVRLACIGGPLEVERNVFCNQATGEPIIHKSPSEYYRRYIEGRGLQKSMIFLGDQVTGPVKIRAYMEADIFVLPSYSEGFSMAVLEAMAAGLPIVATCVGAVPEIIDDGINGFIINPGDTQSLREKITILMKDDELRRRFGISAREYCGKAFVGETGPRALLEILQDTC